MCQGLRLPPEREMCERHTPVAAPWDDHRVISTYKETRSMRVNEVSSAPLASQTRRNSRRRPQVTRHAIDRWAERVASRGDNEPDVTLERFLSLGRRRPRPRHWTTAAAAPGTTFVYLAEQPDVCVVLRGSTAVTVLTRSLCRGAAA
jgi:hypothetical protein